MQRLGQRRGRVVGALAQFLIYHVDAVAVILNHLDVVDDGLYVLFFFHLLVDEPFKHALCGVIVLLGAEGEQLVDALGDGLLVAQRTFEHVKDVVPLGGYGLDGAKIYLAVTRDNVVEKYFGMVLFFLELNFEPFSHTWLSLCVTIGGHRQI